MKKYLCFVILFFIDVLNAKIVDINSINEMEKYLSKEDALVVFDIDNTLMEPVQDIGSDQWFQSRINVFRQTGLDSFSAVKKAYDEWHRIQSLTEVKPVEEDTKKVFDKVKANYKTIALTTRGFQSTYVTMKALESIGIDFGKDPYISEDIFFHNGEAKVVMPGVLFFKGILFTNNTHKGEALFKLLDKTGKKAKTIVFINDKKSHLEQVEESANKRNIAFMGLRYGYTDEKVRKFDPNIAEIAPINFSRLIKEIGKENSKAK